MSDYRLILLLVVEIVAVVVVVGVRIVRMNMVGITFG
jgi:hypothetical protein